MENLNSKIYPELKYINVNTLKFDDAYQRILMPNHVNNISKTFDPNAFQPITVNQRENGDLVVIDGQHRVEAVKLNGDLRLILVPAQVLYLSMAEEVNLFYKINVTKKALSAVDRFYPEVMQKHPDAVFIDNLLKDIDVFHIPNRGTKKNASNSITCVNAMKEIYRECVMIPNETPGSVLDKTLSKVVKGLANFLNMYDGTDFFEMDRLVKTMKKNKPIDIVRIARSYPNNGVRYTVKSGDNLTIAQAIKQKYNEFRSDNPITDSLALWLQDENESVINNKRNRLIIKERG